MEMDEIYTVVIFVWYKLVYMINVTNSVSPIHYIITSKYLNKLESPIA